MFIDLNILKFILWVKRFSFFWNNFHLAFFNHYGKLYQTKLLQIFSFSHVSFPNNIGVFSNISIPRFLVIVSLCWNYEKDLKVLGFKSLEINQRHTNLVLFVQDFCKGIFASFCCENATIGNGMSLNIEICWQKVWISFIPSYNA